MAYTLNVKSYSGGTLTLALINTEGIPTTWRYRVKLFSDSAGTQTVKTSTWVTPSSGDTEIDFSLSSVSPGIYYAQAYSDAPETLTSIILADLRDMTPKIATQAQWEDLADRVKAKSDVKITMTTTDPGEGVALAANNFIAVYEA